MFLFFAQLLVLLNRFVRFGLTGTRWNASHLFIIGRRRGQWRHHLVIGKRGSWNRLMDSIQDDENLFYSSWRAAQVQPDILHAIAWLRANDGSYREAAWKNTVFTGSIKPLADPDILFVLNLFDLAMPAAAIQNSVNVPFLRFHAYFESGIGHQEHLRGEQINRRYFADNAIGRDDSHAFFDIARRSAIDEHSLRR